MARLFNTAAWVDIALLMKTLNKMIAFFLKNPVHLQTSIICGFQQQSVTIDLLSVLAFELSKLPFSLNPLKYESFTHLDI